MISSAVDAVDLSDSLQDTVDEVANYLQMNDSQRTELTSLFSAETVRVREVVNAIQDDLGFDSVLDLLTEAKSIREEFIPALRGLLDDDQRDRLDRKDVEFSGSAVLDIVTDLRGAQRMMDRGVRKVLTEEQKSILDRD